MLISGKVKHCENSPGKIWENYLSAYTPYLMLFVKSLLYLHIYTPQLHPLADAMGHPSFVYYPEDEPQPNGFEPRIYANEHEFLFAFIGVYSRFEIFLAKIGAKALVMDIYELQVKGHLDDRWSNWLGGLTIERHENGTTVLVGPLVDQAALYGVIIRIRDLGLSLLSVSRVVKEHGRMD